jgi:hypothetical protein
LDRIIEYVRGCLINDCNKELVHVANTIQKGLRRRGIHVTADVVDSTAPNMSMVNGLSKLMCQDQLSIEDMTRLVRGELSNDTRPKKSISIQTISSLFQGYVHGSLLVDMCRFGFYPKFNENATYGREPSNWSAAPSRPYKSRLGERLKVNHKSADDYPNAVSIYIRDGRRNGTLLVLDDSLIDKWRLDPSVSIYSSPLGVVAKKGAEITTKSRVITDLSWPHGGSINDMT